MSSSQQSLRVRRWILCGFLVAMLIPYARQVASSPILGQDFRVFFAAGSVVAEQGNPYSWIQLGGQEDALYNRPEALTAADDRYYFFLDYPEGPWLAFGLAPLAALNWEKAFVLFATLMTAALFGGAFLVFRRLGSPLRPALLRAALVTGSPVGFIALFMGQPTPALLLAFAGSAMLARRGSPVLAGALLTVSWIKPNVGLVLPIVVALMEPTVARRLLVCFAAATTALFAATFMVMGTAFLDWPRQVPLMWQAVQGAQPDISSIHSFYYPALDGAFRTVALAGVTALLLAYGAWAIRRVHAPAERALTVLLLWLGGLPFVQSYDTLLLLPVVVFLLGPRLEGWKDGLTQLTVFASMIFPLCYFLGWRIGFFNGFTAIPVAILIIAWHQAVLRPGYSDLAQPKAA